MDHSSTNRPDGDQPQTAKARRGAARPELPQTAPMPSAAGKAPRRAAKGKAAAPHPQAAPAALAPPSLAQSSLAQSSLGQPALAHSSLPQSPPSQFGQSQSGQSQLDPSSPAQPPVAQPPVAQSPFAHSSLSPSPLALIGRAGLWRPRHAAQAQQLRHMPLLFWLIDALKPRQMVQIGLSDASSYLCLCQALDKTSQDSLALGIEAAPAPSPLPGWSAEQRALHDVLYGDVSTLLAAPIEQAAAQLYDRPIDLLLLAQPLSPALIAPLSRHILPRLTERSCVVLLNTALDLPAPVTAALPDSTAPKTTAPQAKAADTAANTVEPGSTDLNQTEPHQTDANTAEAQAQQEIEAFLAELSRGRQALALTEPALTASGPSSTDRAGAAAEPPATGLQIWLGAADLPAPLAAALALAPGTPEHLALRLAFARLGEGLAAIERAQQQASALAEAEAERQALSHKLAALETTLKAEQTERKAAQEGEALQVSVAATLQAQLFDLQGAQAKQAKDLAAAKEALGAQEALAQRLDESQAELAKAQAARAQDQAELAQLRLKLSGAEAAASRAAAAVETAERLEQELAALRQQMREAQDRRIAAWEEHEQLKAAYDRLAAR